MNRLGMVRDRGNRPRGSAYYGKEEVKQNSSDLWLEFLGWMVVLFTRM